VTPPAAVEGLRRDRPLPASPQHPPAPSRPCHQRRGAGGGSRWGCQPPPAAPPHPALAAGPDSPSSSSSPHRGQARALPAPPHPGHRLPSPERWSCWRGWGVGAETPPCPSLRGPTLPRSGRPAPLQLPAPAPRRQKKGKKKKPQKEGFGLRRSQAGGQGLAIALLPSPGR